jgi:hypothetical protein
VGLARNAIYQHLREEPRPLVFLAAAQTARPGTGCGLVIHSEMPLATVAAGITSALKEADTRIAVAFRVFDRQIEDTVVRKRLLAMLSIFFAVVAALLALLGLYGVTKRTNEIGVRMALGTARYRDSSSTTALLTRTSTETDRTSPASLPACPAYADVSEKIVSRKPLGSLTSNARLFHSVS